MSQARETEGPVLEAAGVAASYGRLQVLFDVSVEVPPCGRVALLGTNGAGKSTLLRTVAGLVPADAGSIRFRGADLGTLRPDERVALGMTLVEGGRAMFPSLTVGQNLRMGAYPFLRDRDRVDAAVSDVTELFPQLRPLLDRPAGVCSGGEHQMIALGRAMIAGPSLLMIDELSLGLAPIVMGAIVEAVEELAHRGVALLLVEQSLNVALHLTTWAYFMEKGEVRFAGPTAELMDRGDLVRSVFFGRGSVPGSVRT